MKRESDIKKILMNYTVEDPSDEAKENAKLEIMKYRFPKSHPSFSVMSFLKSQLFTLRPTFWIVSALYLITVCAASFIFRADTSIIVFLAATPFLSVSAIPTLFYNSNPISMELESSCLYRPKTVFAAKSVLCGIFDSAAIIIGSVLTYFIVRTEIKMPLIMGFLSFFSSSIITLILCMFFKTGTGVLVSVGLCCSLSGILFGNQTVRLFVLSLSFTSLLKAVFACIIMMIPVLLFTFKKYEYERTAIKIGY